MWSLGWGFSSSLCSPGCPSTICGKALLSPLHCSCTFAEPSWPYLRDAKSFILFFKDFIDWLIDWLIDFGERWREWEKEGENHCCERETSVASCTCPSRGPGPPPGHAPWLGLELVTFHFVGWCATNWAILVRVCLVFLDIRVTLLFFFSLQLHLLSHSSTVSCWNCGSLNKLPNFSGPQSPHLKDGDHYSSDLIDCHENWVRQYI